MASCILTDGEVASTVRCNKTEACCLLSALWIFAICNRRKFCGDSLKVGNLANKVYQRDYVVLLWLSSVPFPDSEELLLD